MRQRQWIRRWKGFSVVVLGIAWLSGCIQSDDTMPNLLDSGGMVPLPLRQGGEHLDVLVRVRDDKRHHQFNLILEQRDDWPEEKKDRVRRVADGWADGDEPIVPYPIKLRLRIDSVDKRAGILVDQIASTRSPMYLLRLENEKVLLRALNIHIRDLRQGIYRVRIDNLTATPMIDFPTFFKFERDNRKY